jgi:hypothetical protein
MLVPPGNHRGSDPRRTCHYVARFETRGRPGGRLGPRSQQGSCLVRVKGGSRLGQRRVAPRPPPSGARVSASGGSPVFFAPKREGRAFENANARPCLEHVPLVVDPTASSPGPEPRGPLAPSQAPEQVPPEPSQGPEQQALPRVPASSPLPSAGNPQRKT